MDERLSDMVDAALRSISQREMPTWGEVNRCWPALAELLKEVGIFARDMERTDTLHADNVLRQRQERELAAQRLYARLLDPPHADNMVSIPTKGIGRILMLESGRS